LDVRDSTEGDEEHGHFSEGQESKHEPAGDRVGHFSEGQEKRHDQAAHSHFSEGQEEEEEHAPDKEHKGHFGDGGRRA
jgi:hypothetical protein